MERLEQYLDVVSLPVMVAGAIFVVGLFLLIPARPRLYLSLFILPAWLSISRCPDLGMIQAVAKVGGSAMFAMVAVSAVLYPAPRRQLAAATWIFPVMAVVSFAYVMTVIDRETALVLRLQWFLMTIAAIAVCRVMVDAETTMAVLRSIIVGCIFATFVPLSSLMLNPTAAFGSGLGRFFPWGANPNQIGALFALSAPLTLYLAFRARTTASRTILYGLACLPVGMGVLTASRGTVLVMAGTLIPLALVMTRRPLVTFVGVLVIVGGMSVVLGAAEAKDLSRLGSLESERTEIFGQYMEIVAERPLFGLMGTQGESWMAADAIRTNTHNAYLHMVYFGGLSYFVPMIIVIFLSVRAMIRVWKRRTLHDIDPLLTSTLVAYLIMLVLYGMVGVVISYPTYTASFMFVLLCSHFLATEDGMRRGEFILSRTEPEETWEDEEAWEPGEERPLALGLGP